MKSKKAVKYPSATLPGAVLKESVSATVPQEGPMIRTQIYLSREEHDFVANESRRLDEPMAAVIRRFIDEKMEVPGDAWANNPMLRPTLPDPDWKGHEDGAINHDHYIYGSPKKWMKRNDEWVETPPLPDDYFTNSKSRQKYDREVNRST